MAKTPDDKRDGPSRRGTAAGAAGTPDGGTPRPTSKRHGEVRSALGGYGKPAATHARAAEKPVESRAKTPPPGAVTGSDAPSAVPAAPVAVPSATGGTAQSSTTGSGEAGRRVDSAPTGKKRAAAPIILMDAKAPRKAAPVVLSIDAPGDDGQGDRPRLVTRNDGLVARNLGKAFKKRPVLRGVSISVQRGEAVGLLGPNGAGKTTCFYIITGLISADYGTILLDGQTITNLPMYRRSRLGIGYLPQEASIFRGLSVEQNIRAVLELVESDRDRREAMLEDLLAEFSITHLRRTPSVALSGGERRRCEIARALASQPNFILLDEPLAGIDPIAVGDIRDLVSHLKDRGIGVLITDHNVRETLDIVDRAYILHDGQVLMEGPPAEIVRHEGVRRVYLGEKFSL